MPGTNPNRGHVFRCHDPESDWIQDLVDRDRQKNFLSTISFSQDDVQSLNGEAMWNRYITSREQFTYPQDAVSWYCDVERCMGAAFIAVPYEDKSLPTQEFHTTMCLNHADPEYWHEAFMDVQAGILGDAADRPPGTSGSWGEA